MGGAANAAVLATQPAITALARPTRLTRSKMVNMKSLLKWIDK
jgi:hypothetical protein